MTIKQQGGIFGRNPSFNDVSANTTTTDTLTADASADGSVVIVKRDGSNVGSLGAKSGDFFISSDAMGMRFRDSISAIIPSVDGATGSDASFDLGNDSNRWRKLYLSGNLVVASGSGIDFSATSGTGTSELFDDYEEGTWTPTPQNFDGTPTVEGYYTKIGNMVFASFYIALDGTSDGSTFSVLLPFSSYNGTNAMFGSAISYTTSTVTGLSFRVRDANTEFRAYNNSGGELNYNAFGASAAVSGTIIYRAA